MPAPKGIQIPSRVAERAFNNWEPSPSGCLISTYSTASHGYAQIGWRNGGRTFMTTAHRAAWTHMHGQIPFGITIDHLPTCNRRCVNTDHLRELTNYENARRTFGRDWPLGECVNGHSNDYLHQQPNGRTRCQLCKRMDDERYRARKRKLRTE